MALLIAFFLLSIVFSFCCSIWEAVLLSVTPSYIKREENENSATGKLLSKLKTDIDQPLSAILTLNTIAHTVGAIGVGAQAGKLFGANHFSFFGLQVSYESIIATLMTLGILFLSEIIPKTIGANNWRSLAAFTARSLNVLIILLKPFVWVSIIITKALKKDKSQSVLSKKDFSAMADIIGESGQIEERDYILIKNVLQFDNLVAKDVMTPRSVIVTADETQTLQDFYENSKPLRFSRIPLYQNQKDNISGLLLKDEMLQGMIDGKSAAPLKEIKRELPVVEAGLSLRKVFEFLHEKREHLAVVIDEFGTVAGLVTLEDVIETLFGLEIMDETDSVSDLQEFARQKWEERAKKLGLIR